ncbi:MAG: NRAMP family divalent metal transporter, partial [Gemmatimonadota bacterium]
MADRHRTALIGAAFLMATSAIGPGFLTQTAVFTERLGASFAFAILVSVVIDLVAQLNIWRVLVVSGRRASEVANLVAPGLGTGLTVLVVVGGLAFNVGNVAGAGLGLRVLLGIPVEVGALLSALLAIGLFLSKEAGRAMDRFAVALGFVLVALTIYVASASAPPIGEALVRAVRPERVDLLSIVTIVGGTVGGYITFSGAHRLLDEGLRGPEALPAVTRSATTAIGVASLMRVQLFLAALGVVSQGLALDPANPPAAVFLLAVGQIGYRLFGLVMWCAAITSVVGAAYTSVSFLRSLHPTLGAHWTRVVIAFIATAAAAFLLIGQPVRVLVLVGAINGV